MHCRCFIPKFFLVIYPLSPLKAKIIPPLEKIIPPLSPPLGGEEIFLISGGEYSPPRKKFFMSTSGKDPKMVTPLVQLMIGIMATEYCVLILVLVKHYHLSRDIVYFFQNLSSNKNSAFFVNLEEIRHFR